MKREHAVATLVGLIVASASVRAGDECDDRAALIRLAAAADVEDFNATYGSTTIASILSRNIHLLRVPAGTNYSDFVELTAGAPALQSIEQNCPVTDTSPEGGTRTFFFGVQPGAYQNQIAASIIGIESANAVSRGAGSIVAIIDTGVAPHPLIAPRLVAGGMDFVAGGNGVGEAGDGLDNDGDGFVDEMVGHGTFIAGLVLRVAPDAGILPIRVMNDEGISSTFLLTSGVYHAIDHGADVLNISMGSTESSIVLSQAIDAGSAAGAMIVASVGNEGNQTPIRFPAGYAGVVAVAATADDDVRADFSNFGAHVALCAPGVLLASTDVGDSFVAASGTSFSAPLAAGTLALLRQADPGAATGALIAAMLETTDAIAASNPGFDGLLGTGRLSAAGAVHSDTLCRGDISGDRRVSIDDLTILLSAFGTASGASFVDGDLTGDGAVQLADLTLMLSAFGRICQ